MGLSRIMQEPPGRATKPRYRFTSTIHPINPLHLAYTTTLCHYAKLQLQSRMLFLAAKHQIAHTALLDTATTGANMFIFAHGVASRTAGCVRAYCRVTLAMVSCLAVVLGPDINQIYHSCAGWYRFISLPSRTSLLLSCRLPLLPLAPKTIAGFPSLPGPSLLPFSSTFNHKLSVTNRISHHSLHTHQVLPLTA